MVKRFLRQFFIFSLFLVCHSIFAQKHDYILGKVFDSKSNEPVVFANIRVKDRAVGVITNSDGSFRIPLSYKQYGNIIEVSSMGYQTKEISITEFDQNELNIIKLNPGAIDLQEAIVKAKDKRKRLSAKKIVQRAIESIGANYPTSPYSQVGYYRDYQLDQGEYVNLNEAILEVFDLGFKAIDTATTRALLYDYRQNQEFERDSLAAQPYDYNLTEHKGGKIIDNAYLEGYGGNEFRILSIHNAIRNYKLSSYSFVYHLETDFLEDHQFSREDDAFIDDESLYSIKIYKKIKMNRAYGRLLISKSDFSIYKMEYTVYDDTKKNASGIKDKNGSKNRIVFEVNTSYRKKDARMFLNYISFHNNFTVKIPPVFKLTFADFKMNYDRMHRRKYNLKVDETLSDSYFELTFSDKVDEAYASNLKNYKAQFEGERVHFDTIKVVGKKVWLFPRLKSRTEQQMLKDIEVLAANEKLNNQVLQFDIENVRNVYGNIINDWKTKDYNQFREFFVQQVKTNSKSPVSGSFMKKDAPIFKDQPIAKPDNFDDYWMNTPLQKTIEDER